MARYMADRGCDTLFVDGSLDSLLPEGSVARVIWSALEGLDFSRFDERYRNDLGGAAGGGSAASSGSVDTGDGAR
jgi:hypothetical protein